MNRRLSVTDHWIFCLFMFLSALRLYSTFSPIFHVLVRLLCCVTASLWLYLNWRKQFILAALLMHHFPCSRASLAGSPQFRYMCVHLNAGVSIQSSHIHTHFHWFFVNMHQGYQLLLCLFEACILLHLLPVMLLSLSISCLHRCCAVSLWFGSVCREMKGRGSHTDGAEVSMVMYCRWAGKSSQLARKRRRWRVRR